MSPNSIHIADQVQGAQMQAIPKFDSLAPRQIRLHRKLLDKSPSLASMYLGALHVHSQDMNPDYLSLAAHGMRELMEKFPLYVDLRIRPNMSMGEKVNQLESTWGKAQNSCCRKEGTWVGEIDAYLKAFLMNADEFFLWKRLDMPSRTTKVLSTLRMLDAAKRPIPQAVEKIMAELWKELNSYFQGVAHHSKNTTDEEFRGYVRSLEDFLIDRIDPRTFDVFDAIDKVIAVEKLDAN
jgi:hypothetical protein